MFAQLHAHDTRIRVFARSLEAGGTDHSKCPCGIETPDPDSLKGLNTRTRRSAVDREFGYTGLITPPLKGGYLTPHHPPVFCAIDVIIGRYRVFILSMSRVFIVSLCCVKF